MTEPRDEVGALRVERRQFIGAALRALGALAALPTASAMLAGCGSGDESADPSPAAPPAAGAARPPEVPPPTPEPETAAPAAPPASAGAGTLVTEVDAMRPTVEALQYVNESTRADQRCANCLFYTATGDARGRCQLFPQGEVSVRGWCSSWSAKPAA